MSTAISIYPMQSTLSLAMVVMCLIALQCTANVDGESSPTSVSSTSAASSGVTESGGKDDADGTSSGASSLQSGHTNSQPRLGADNIVDGNSRAGQQATANLHSTDKLTDNGSDTVSSSDAGVGKLVGGDGTGQSGGGTGKTPTVTDDSAGTLPINGRSDSGKGYEHGTSDSQTSFRVAKPPDSDPSVSDLSVSDRSVSGASVSGPNGVGSDQPRDSQPAAAGHETAATNASSAAGTAASSDSSLVLEAR